MILSYCFIKLTFLAEAASTSSEDEQQVSQDGWRWDEESTEVEHDVSTSSEDGGVPLPRDAST